MRPSVPSRAATLIAAAVLLTGCSSDQEDGSTLKADPDLPFASFEGPADGSTLEYRGELMAPDWDLHGTLTLRGECLGVLYTDDSGDHGFVTLALPMPASWDVKSQTVSGDSYKFAVGDELDVSGMLIQDETALPTACEGETPRILVSNNAWIH
ncbi:hypothetical protein NF556_15165 [Ornithinimicrobium faecis]|uniref:Lipoprotein n=1 Tax=Ornithinimicrobium faecis TaxID=2934158 RepID=A0ABY4YQA5_9MICO|nr:hypothetical protein [Ornithinimicrobium sp. HY1793]USQ78955.1 hypothetical protein NF556_15165 [Ornithinimicrobium sp. HY1793]